MHLLAAEGVIDVRRHRGLRQRVARAVERGHLTRLLPGIYGPGEGFAARVQALRVWDPDAVLTGATAAKASWWPELEVDHIQASSVRNARALPSGFDVRRIELPDEMIRWSEAGPLVSPAMGVLQMLPSMGSVVIDEALRRRVLRVGDLEYALAVTPGRPGNALAARLVRDSRDEPWSPLEREAHCLLREAGVTGWLTNLPVRLEAGTVFLDIAWPRFRLAVELDGWQFHQGHGAFVADRQRDVALTTHGWTVLRFTAVSLPQLVPAVRQMLRTLGA